VKGLSFYNVLIFMEKGRDFLSLSVFFQKKSEYPAIKRKLDALIEMKTLPKTPINAARKSYESCASSEKCRISPDCMTVMRSKTTDA